MGKIYVAKDIEANDKYVTEGSNGNQHDCIDITRTFVQFIN
jgi:hypothetical protein